MRTLQRTFYLPLLLSILLYGTFIRAEEAQLPVNQTFNMVLPDTNIWPRISTGSGRIQVVPDTTATGITEWVTSTKLPKSVSIPNYFVGNTIYCDETTVLRDFSVPLNNAIKSTVYFLVYKQQKLGNFSLVASNSTLCALGESLLNSGALDITLTKGSTYVIGTGWSTAKTCYFQTTGHPNTLSFGHTTTGSTYPAAIPPSTTLLRFTNTTYTFLQQYTTCSDGILRMDSSVTNSMATNSITLQVDLADYPSAMLEFRHRENGDESNYWDGVFLSTNNSSWIRLFSLDVTDTNWHIVCTNIVDAAAAAGITLSDTSYIRFQQVDNYPWTNNPADGREFDDITLYTQPNLDYDSISCTAIPSIFNTLYLRGTGIPQDIPLKSDIIWTGGTNALPSTDLTWTLLNASISGTPVHSETFTWDCNFAPLSRTTGTLSRTFVIPPSVKISNFVNRVQGVVDANHALSEDTRLDNTNSTMLLVNHYSGTLSFDNIETTITITNSTSRGGSLSSTNHYISGTGTWNGVGFSFLNLPALKNPATLDYSIAPDVTNQVYVPMTGQQYSYGLYYQFTNGVMLSRTGAYANAKVRLPAGMGVSTVPGQKMQSAFITFEGVRLYQTTRPYTVTKTGYFLITEETKPFFIETDEIEWNSLASHFRFNPTDVIYVRAYEANRMHAQNNPKKSNEGYYESLGTIGSYCTINYSASRQAELNATVTLNAGTNTAYFPYGVTNQWSSGRISISGDRISSSSCLTNTAGYDVAYSRNCPSEKCGASTSDGAARIVNIDNRMNLTAQGGLQSSIGIEEGGHALLWGSYSGTNCAYRTDVFERGSYFMPGHFTLGSDRVFPEASYLEPSSLLLSGVMTNDLSEYERHGTTNECTGAADYAGLNLRVDEDGAKNATSIFAQKTRVDFPLSGRSKFYVRSSGVSGIYEVQPEKFPSDEMDIYGYPFTFSNYGLAFLSNDNTESRTEGETYLQFPSDFTLAFEEMIFSCLGDLDSAEVPDGIGELQLAYWNANFEPYTIQFRAADPADCSDTTRFLLLGIRTYCANIDPQLYGVVGFFDDGNFIPPSFGHQDTDSRLSVPSSLEIDGPQGETYTFYPVSSPYFNNYDAETNDANFGFINFAGSLDVPFFENILIQFQTSASTNAANAPIYVMGGWPTDGWTNSAGQSFFDPITFDEDNTGFPVDDLTLSEYRAGADGFRPRALRNWLSVVDFDYPLNYDTSSRSFASHEPEFNNLMVLTVEHQIDYLSADNAEISFGLQYDGLPSINLVSMAYEAVDDATGAASDIFSGALSNLWQPILSGLDDMDSMLSTLPQDMLGNVLDGLIDPVIDDLYMELTNSYRIDPSSYYSNNIDQYISGSFGPASSYNINARLGFLIEGNSSVELNLTDDLLARLQQVETLLSAFNTNVTIDNQDYDGLLAVNIDEYPMLELLANNLIGALASEYIDLIGSQLEPAIKDQLAAVNTSLQTVRGSLGELYDVVTNLHYRLDASAKLDFYQELSATIDTSVIQSVCTNAANEMKAFFDELPTLNASLPEYTADEIKTMIKQKITDQFYACSIPTDISQVLRQRLYDVDSSIRRSCDSVFQQVNTTLKNILSEYLTGIDDAINECLGDVSDFIGAGQIDGYAHINGDSLTELRLDGAFQWQVPDELEFKGYLIIRQIDSDSPASCGGGSEPANEVIMGTEGFGIDWISEIKADIETKFTFKSGPFQPAGLAGSFEMVEGTIGFESFSITEFCAAAGFGLYENYVSAACSAEFDKYKVAGGAFFGRTCTIDPIAMWDEEAAEVLGEPPFTGIYTYGEGWMPIINYGCVFNVSAGVGAGIFYFVEGPTIGGKIMLGASGEALCVVSVDGTIKMAGAKSGDEFRMAGSGKISGKAGKCPFCVKFSKTVDFTYINGDFEADY